MGDGTNKLRMRVIKYIALFWKGKVQNSPTIPNAYENEMK